MPGPVKSRIISGGSTDVMQSLAGHSHHDANVYTVVSLGRSGSGALGSRERAQMARSYYPIIGANDHDHDRHLYHEPPARLQISQGLDCYNVGRALSCALRLNGCKIEWRPPPQVNEMNTFRLAFPVVAINRVER
jgi:hypothetical protein